MDALVTLDVADPPELWERIGFTVVESRCTVGGIVVRLGRPGRGVTGWRLQKAAVPGLPLSDPEELVVRDQPEGPDHPNGVVSLDHVVIATPDVDRTIDAFEEAGIPLRRTRRTGAPDRPMLQAFFRLDNTVAEVVGPATAAGAGPASFYGLAFMVVDLDACAARLGRLLSPPKEAVQPGRRIATLDRSAGSTVPIAFLSPRIPAPVRD